MAGDQPMLLSEELFQEICGICLIDPRNDGSERREHPRVDLGRRTTVISRKEHRPGPAYVAIIRDMSLKGVALLQSEEVHIGDEFILDVARFVGRTLGVRCRVERVEPGGSGGTQFVVGATFTSLIESAEDLIPAPEPAENLEPEPACAWRTLLTCVSKRLTTLPRPRFKFPWRKPTLPSNRTVPR
jgi:hypothetical protein